MDRRHAVSPVVGGLGVAYCNSSIISGQDLHSVASTGALRLLEHLRVPLRIAADQRWGKSGQLRPYVRPVARRMPLATMGVRFRVRHQSGQRAQGTTFGSVLPELP